MTKMRVYEVAKEYNLSSKEIMWALDKIGVEVKSHMSMVENADIEQILKYFNINQPKEETKVKEKDETAKPKANVKKVVTEGKPANKKFTPQLKTKPPKNKKNKKSKAKGDKVIISSESRPKELKIKDKIAVQELADNLGVSGTELIKKLISLGLMATINQEIDYDTASILASEYGVDLLLEVEEDLFMLKDEPEDESKQVERPPVVTVMGHVDHGKTSLLDTIRNENVVSTEAGGITQHIGAYQVKVGDRKITFLDTPGHEAFTAMRARGAQATDIAILVVAADDGVKPQTVEAINHAKAAKVPIIVAINKIDKPNANIEKVKQELTEYGLVAEEWGGDTIMVPVSATKKQGIDHLLEMVLLVAEMEELKANPNREAVGIVIEAQLDKGRGPVATILIQKGTITVGDSLIAGASFGKVRAMINDRGVRIKKAGPSTPVEILGLSDVPEAGEIVRVVDEKIIRDLAGKIKDQKREEELKKSRPVNLDDIFKQMEAGEVKELNVIVKADVQGSVEAMQQSLHQLSTEEVKIVIIHGGVGAITETDVMLASASGAIIIGFNVRPDVNSRKAAEIKQVDIRTYRIIYEALDDIKKAMSGLLDPEIKEVVLGRAEVRATFKVPKAGVIAGSYVTDGKFINSALVRIIRNGVVIHEGKIDSLKRFKDDVKEVAQGYECGIGVENFNDIKEQDIIEAYKYEEIKREL
ncbi:translation initiation factor IF-2 [Desulfitibacter alkalitolerans]|uniref:translation initiation factor IF-2 n=1 Tax=Desulfitibacter alkalitolerans TaxID=264641 RepID=UPI000484B9EE|nr:translation initiation factor IF-2 [Desulfitibacter alkalitolerans]